MNNEFSGQQKSRADAMQNGFGGDFHFSGTQIAVTFAILLAISFLLMRMAAAGKKQKRRAK
jgi:hypothetical protein